MTANAFSRLLRGRIAFLAAVLFFAGRIALAAQETSLEEIPGLREQAVVMRIVSRIVEQDQQVWNSENSRVTLPGRPVGLKLVGANLVVAIQFTPFLRSDGRHFLVAQGQIWINNPNEGGMYFHTIMQTIPLQFGEQVYFFPLGSKETEDEAHIEIQVVLEPYSRETAPRDRDRNRNNGRNPGTRRGNAAPP